MGKVFGALRGALETASFWICCKNPAREGRLQRSAAEGETSPPLMKN